MKLHYKTVDYVDRRTVNRNRWGIKGNLNDLMHDDRLDEIPCQCKDGTHIECYKHHLMSLRKPMDDDGVNVVNRDGKLRKRYSFTRSNHE